LVNATRYYYYYYSDSLVCLRSSSSEKRSIPVRARIYDAVTAALKPILVPWLAVPIHVCRPIPGVYKWN